LVSARLDSRERPALFNQKGVQMKKNPCKQCSIYRRALLKNQKDLSEIKKEIRAVRRLLAK
jgi:hypothetical protein